MARKQSRPVNVPVYFMSALRKTPKALEAFDAFPPSHKREYVEWIEEARREETRARRIASAIEQIANGKSRQVKAER